MMKSRLLKWSLATLAVVLVALVAVLGYGYHMLQQSKPQYEGEVSQLGLSAEVSVARDAQGIAVIQGQNRVDVSHALGFVHAQERYFQMDLLRRAAAGELSELFGKDALVYDLDRRLHQFRQRAQGIYRNLTAAERQNLDAYVQGVNQGLNALAAVPVEYSLIGEVPRPWAAEDSLLVAYAMYFDLQDSTGGFDITRGIMQHTLPADLYAYLTDHETDWRSVLIEGEHEYAQFPPLSSFDFLRRPASASTYSTPPDRHLGGSNQWAVRFERDGKMQAILANDMHLGLGVPNLWFRTSLNYKHEGQAVAVNGVTLPGLPVMIIGSNGKVSWGFTNSQINLDDVFVLESAGENQYLSHEGVCDFDVEVETILVKDAEAEQLTIRKTPYGPVLRNQYFGQDAVFRWTAHLPDSVNIRHFDFELAENVTEAIAMSRQVKMPTMNFMLADHAGNIGWTLIGPIPAKREGYTGLVPVELMSLPTAPAMDVLDAADYPTLINPESGLLWTANNQTASGAVGDLLGDGAYINGSRAKQIHLRLLATENPSIDSMLAIQLDDEAMFLKRWHQLLVDLLQRHQPASIPAQLVSELNAWDGHARADSAAYFVIREFRWAATNDILGKLFAEGVAEWDGFDLISFDYEEPVWNIIQHQVGNLLDADQSNWDEQLTLYLNKVIQDYRQGTDGLRLDEMKWGLHNQAAIQHPFSEAVPVLSQWLDAPADPLSGDYYMPLIARPAIGASQRMVVMPGDEAHAVFHMPGGQSGHALSPFYLKGHEDWVQGRKTPLLPGPAIYQMALH